MTYFLFILYLIISLFIIYRSRLMVKTGVDFLYWMIFFFIKIGAACFYGYWYSKNSIELADTWFFQNESLKETELLKHHPYQFFTNLFNADYVNSGGLFDVFGFWNDLKSNIIIKMLAVFNIFSNSNYYINTVLYSLITFWGFILIYRAIQQTTTTKPSIITWLVLCFTPSCLFWTSGIHRDGLILLCIGFILYQITKQYITTLTKVIGLLKILAIFLVLFLLRNYVALLLAPIIIAWLLKQFTGIASNKIVIAVYALLIIFLYSSKSIQQNIINRKTEFENLQGNSRLSQIDLSPNGASFIKATPKSIDRIFLRPYIWQTAGVMEKMAALENIAFIIFMAFFLRRFSAQHRTSHKNTLWPLYIFCLSVLLLVGIIVPFVGAIVRYKAIFIMLIALSASLYIQKPALNSKNQ